MVITPKIVIKLLFSRALRDCSLDPSLRTVMAQKAQKTGLPYILLAASQKITETTCPWESEKPHCF